MCHLAARDKVVSVFWRARIIEVTRMNFKNGEGKMGRKMLSLAVAVAFMASPATMSLAASAKCKVKSVSGNTVTLECSSKASKLKAGDRVKVKTAKKREAINGC